MRIKIYFYIIISISFLTLPLSTSHIIFLPVSIYLFFYFLILVFGPEMQWGMEHMMIMAVTMRWLEFEWYLSICLSVCPSVCVSVCLSVQILFVFPSVCGYEFLWGNILIDCDWFEDYCSLNECYCTYCMFNHFLSACTLPHSLCNSFWQYWLIFLFTSTDLW